MRGRLSSVARHCVQCVGVRAASAACRRPGWVGLAAGAIALPTTQRFGACLLISYSAVQHGMVSGAKGGHHDHAAGISKGGWTRARSGFN